MLGMIGAVGGVLVVVVVVVVVCFLDLLLAVVVVVEVVVVCFLTYYCYYHDFHCGSSVGKSVISDNIPFSRGLSQITGVESCSEKVSALKLDTTLPLKSSLG